MPDRAVTNFLNGHTDPTTLPQLVIDATPPQMLGYVAVAYLAGVQVGRAQPADQPPIAAAALREAALEWDKVAAQYGAASTANLGQEFDQLRQAQRATHMAEWLRHRADTIEQEAVK